MHTTKVGRKKSTDLCCDKAQILLFNFQRCNALIDKLLISEGLHSDKLTTRRVITHHRDTGNIALFNSIECQFVARFGCLHNAITLSAVKRILTAHKKALVACMIWLTSAKDGYTT